MKEICHIIVMALHYTKNVLNRANDSPWCFYTLFMTLQMRYGLINLESFFAYYRMYLGIILEWLISIASHYVKVIYLEGTDCVLVNLRYMEISRKIPRKVYFDEKNNILNYCNYM